VVCSSLLVAHAMQRAGILIMLVAVAMDLNDRRKRVGGVRYSRTRDADEHADRSHSQDQGTHDKLWETKRHRSTGKAVWVKSRNRLAFTQTLA
jgi:hypothetical protein